MPLSENAASDLARSLYRIRELQSDRLDTIHTYVRDDPDERVITGLPPDTPATVQRLARISRVNLLRYVVAARVQAMYVDGFQTPDSAENVAAWELWQQNKLDARQVGIHRAALKYGAAYATVLRPSDRVYIRGRSPRQLTVGWPRGDDNADWPEAALLWSGDRWMLLDDESTYPMERDQGGEFRLLDEPTPHNARFQGERVCPVVRYRDTEDLDEPVRGVVEPLLALQDQINLTTFGLQVGQHYGAFRQRYVIGWMAESEKAALHTSAAKLMTWEDHPNDISVGEFSQTELRGYIDSRQESVRQMATVSQTPVHELIGEVVNVSASALEAMRASHHAAVGENRIMAGESHEQTLNLAGEMAGEPPDDQASVIWRDTRVRSLQDAASALGDLVERLGVPPRELWHRIPGVAQHELERWKNAADQGDAFSDLEAMLDRQSASAAPGDSGGGVEGG